MAKDIDKLSREKIRNDINTNFFVEAGAGSGKTSVLVDRMASMVEGGVDISKICAITFTKAAAGEFYARFQKKLSESKTARAKEALKNIDLCFMGTIDSFCNMVLSEHPAEAKIPSNAVITSKEEMAALYIREFSTIQRGDKGKELQKKCKRFKDYYYNATDIFVSGLSIIMASKNAHFNYVKPKAGEPDDVFKAERERILPILEYLHNHPEALAIDKPKAAKEAYEKLEDEYTTIMGSWNDNLGSIAKILNTLSGLRVIKDYDITLLGIGYDTVFAPHTTDKGAIKWYDVIMEDTEDPLAVKKIKDFQFAVAMDFILEAAKVISDDLRKEGKLTFFDYLLYLRDLLKEDAGKDGKLINHIYNRHSFFLIDEFQDTNPIQAEVFFYLTAKDPKVDWTKCIPKAGSLFIVGDPKQSIYRFRNADVASFLNVRKLFENPDVGEVLYLTRNFRSSDNMCSWFNQAFTRLLPADTGIQSKFSEIPTGEKGPYTASLEGAYKYDVQYTRSNEDSAEFETVADIIQKLVSGGVTIQDRDIRDENNNVKPSILRKPEYKDIMLITPRKTRLSFFMNEFIKRDIPVKVEGKVLFNECPALYSLSLVMEAVADPFNAKARFAAEKLSGLNVSETAIFEYAKKAKQMSPAAVFSMIMDDEKLFSRICVDNAEYVYFALELLRSGETSGEITSVQDGAKFISGLVNNKSEEERCIQLTRDNNRVHIANLHKVKGLEAPIVILADPRDSSKEAYSRVDYSKNPPESYIFALDNSVKSSDFAAEKALEETVLAAEETRLLYVAATRAGNALIIADMLDKDGNSKDSNPWYPFLSITSKDIVNELKAIPLPAAVTKTTKDASSLYDEAEKASVMNDKTSEDASYHIEKPSQIKLKSVTSNEDNYEDEMEEAYKKSSKKHNAALIGTIVHRLMEVLVLSKGQADVNELIPEIAKEYDADSSYYKDILTKVADVVLNGGFDQDHGAPKDIISELISADEVYTEVPFCYDAKDGNIVNGVMDAFYLKDGEWHIIDYKTDDEIDPEGLKHQAQLDAYVEAFKQLTGNDADAKIYHIAI